MLVQHMGFQTSDITMMLDTDPSTIQPTGAHIKAKLTELVGASRSGDVLVFHFSGHGTQVPSDDPEEEDHMDEAICPCDMNVVCDDDLRDIFSKLDPGVKLTFIADCCHSGTLLDHSEVVISGAKDGQPVPDVGMALIAALMGGGGAPNMHMRNRSLPTNKLMQMLSQKLGVPVTPGSVQQSLGKLFGSQASSKVNRYLALASKGWDVLQQSKKGGKVSMSGFMSSMVKNFGSGSKPGATTAPRLADDVGILITGCQAHETSADACPGGDPQKAYGALTNAIRTVVTAHHDQNPGAPLSSRSLVAGVRDTLSKAGFAQNPCLECSQRNADSSFILH